MKTTLAGVVTAVVVLLYTAPLFAHHSFAAEFDSQKPIVIKGTLTKLEMTNPHSWLYLNVKDEKTGKISTMSPIGKGLLGKKKGDTAKIKTPAGEMEFEIVNIGV